MDISVDYHLFRNRIRAFAEANITPYATQMDVQEALLPCCLDAMKSQGFLGANIPIEYGGLGLDSIQIGILNEEIGRASASLRCLLTVQGMAAVTIYKWGTIEQKAYWLPRLASGNKIIAFALAEPNAGSDASNLESIVVKNNDLTLNGHKIWIAMGEIADAFLVFAREESGISSFIVARASLGVDIVPVKGLLGNRAVMMAEANFSQCPISDDMRIGKKGCGLSHVAMLALDYGRYTVAWGCVGVAQACLEFCQKHTQMRIQFGKPLIKFELVQKMMTEIISYTKAARTYCLEVGRVRDRGEPEMISETWIAKYIASKAVNRVAYNAVQIAGGQGCINTVPVERYYRDARVMEIIEGNTQLCEELIASWY